MYTDAHPLKKGRGVLAFCWLFGLEADSLVETSDRRQIVLANIRERSLVSLFECGKDPLELRLLLLRTMRRDLSCTSSGTSAYVIELPNFSTVVLKFTQKEVVHDVKDCVTSWIPVWKA